MVNLKSRSRAPRRFGAARALVIVAALCVLLLLLWQLLCGAYPVFFREEVFDCAAQNGLSPYLVLAVVRVESGFDPTATSPRGARGLMQVMPDTGRWAAGIMRIEPFSPGSLYDPYTNLRVGCWYLSYLLRRYEGDLVLALAAYNSGPARVDAWREELAREGGGEGGGGGEGEGRTADDRVRAIPYGETRRFVSRVMRDFSRYRAIYEERLGEGER